MAAQAAAEPSGAAASAGYRLSEDAWHGRIAAAARVMVQHPYITIRFSADGSFSMEVKNGLAGTQCTETKKE